MPVKNEGLFIGLADIQYNNRAGFHLMILHDKSQTGFCLKDRFVVIEVKVFGKGQELLVA
jgi:hypothetical protein